MNSEKDLTNALAMMEDYRKRALKAEFELRRLRRAINAWSARNIAMSPLNPEETIVILHAAAVFPNEKAERVAEKLGWQKN